MDDLHTDANAIAALLEQVLGPGATAMDRRCQSCREVGPLAAHRLYRGAGLVARCPHCGDLAMRIGLLGERVTVEWHGVYELRPAET
ncbi:MAG: DUF6510 family protein [Actinomycetota bacterium]|nr:DUF6510 family protein [Actinomycetota bacterium]